MYMKLNIKMSPMYKYINKTTFILQINSPKMYDIYCYF